MTSNGHKGWKCSESEDIHLYKLTELDIDCPINYKQIISEKCKNNKERVISFSGHSKYLNPGFY